MRNLWYLLFGGRMAKHHEDRDEMRLLREILHEIREVLDDVRLILQKLRPHLVSIQIQDTGAIGMDITRVVGVGKPVKVIGKDQDGNPFPIDFAANPPQWSVDQTSNVGLAPGDTPDAELVTGLGVTTTPAVLAVSCAGLTATSNVTVTAAPPVLTSIEIVE